VAKRPVNKMSVNHRAKQFIPFAALKGYEEALKNKEKQHEEYVEKTGKVPVQSCINEITDD